MADRVTRPKRVVWSGPLSEFGPGFGAELQRLGFTPLSVVHQSRLAAHLSRWMQDQGLQVGQLTSDRIDEFLVERRTTHTNRFSRRSPGTLLGFLNRLGVLPVQEPSQPALPELLAAERVFVESSRTRLAVVCADATAASAWKHPMLVDRRMFRADRVDQAIVFPPSTGSVGNCCTKRRTHHGNAPRWRHSTPGGSTGSAPGELVSVGRHMGRTRGRMLGRPSIRQ